MTGVRRWWPIVLTAGGVLAAGVFASRLAPFFRPFPAPRPLTQAEAALFAAADSGDKAGVAAALAAR
jgi:hypothetical protein